VSGAPRHALRTHGWLAFTNNRLAVVDAAPTAKPGRERILDAAAAVMRDKGITSATTKAIAAAAGYSEPMLYKHFADKQELFLAVLEERLPSVRPAIAAGGATGDLVESIAAILEQLMSFYVEVFPLTASLYGDPKLLARHREGVRRAGDWGPTGPILLVREYLDIQRDEGRVREDADTEAAAQLLVGAAFQSGFLATFSGRTAVPDAAARSRALAAAILPSLT